MAKVRMVDPEECEPMPELEREFYSQSSFHYLKRVISADGYNPAYPLRALWDLKRKRYIVFDGIHRLKVCISLGLDTVPVVLEDIPREQALAEGYKANRTHEWYNTIDKARHLKKMAETMQTRTTLSSFALKGGRGHKSVLHDVSKATGEDLKTIKRHIRLLELPSSVKENIGKGKLKYSNAIEICKLLGTEKEHLIPRVSEKAQNMSSRETASYVQAIISGTYHAFKACDVCGKSFPKENMGRMNVCPGCNQRIRTSGIRTSISSTSGGRPFMDYVQQKRLEEINTVRRKMGLKPLGLDARG